MHNSLLLFSVVALLLQVSSRLSAQNPPVDCDTVPVVAQAAGGYVTCTSVSTTLTGLEHPSALDYHWRGPGPLAEVDVHERVVEWYRPGVYTLTVTGKYGCTAQTSAVIADSCKFYPLVPPECPDPYLFPAEECFNVCVRQFIPVHFWFTNADALYGPPPLNFCGVTHNDQWFAFVAGATSGTITLETANCQMGDGLQMALYEDCEGASYVACNIGLAGGANQPLTLNVSGLTVGKVYYLLVDGYNGDRCDYQFIIDGNICTAQPAPPGNPKLNGISQVCPEALTFYEINSPPNATAFLWNGPPGSLINGMPSPVVLYNPGGELVYVEFGDEPGFITVRALYYFQPPSAPLGIAINMQPVPPTILPEKKVCFEDTPFIWGEAPYTVLSTPGTYTLTSDPYKSYLGCDSIVEQRVVISPPIVTNIGTIVRCSGDCYTINGNDYCETGGPYAEVLESWNGCDSTVIFSLIVPDPVAEITGGGTLTCATTSITLGAAPANGVKRWLNGGGQVIGLGNTLTVTAPGTYILTNTLTASGVNCIKSDTVEILQDVASPEAFAAVSGVLTCSTPAVTLSGDASPASAILHWSGPDGFSSTEANPQVTIPGVYTLTATGPNGCSGTATVTVDADQTPPTAAAQGGTVTCLILNITLSGISNDPDGGFVWSGPGGFFSTLPHPEAGLPGIYTLTVTGANGCSATATAEVIADQQQPDLTAAGGVLTCLQTSIVLDAVLSDPDAAIEWSGPGGFLSHELHPGVDKAGVYTLTATAANGCTGTVTAEVFADQYPPPVSAFADTLDCTKSEANLYGMSGDSPDVLFFWTGPGGFQSNLQNPKAPEAGIYVLTVTNPINGCTAQTQVTVVADLDIPGIDVKQWPPACGDSLLYLDATSPLPGAQFFWTGPNGFTAQTEDVQVTVADWYRVEVTAPNGCSSEIQILALPAPPVPQVSIFPAEPVLTCVTPAIMLTASADVAGCTFVWSMPGNGPINQPGIYQVTATTPDGCTGTAQVTVQQDADPPALSAEGGVLTCEQPTTLITAFTTTPGTTITWYGPGFPTNQNPALVSEPGMYTAVATAPNGCTSSVEVTVVDSCLVSTKDPGNLKRNDIVVYPNPGTGTVYLKSLYGATISAVALHRIDGVLIRTETPGQTSDSLRFDWRDLPAGVYMVSVLIEQFWVTKPLILLE